MGDIKNIIGLLQNPVGSIKQNLDNALKNLPLPKTTVLPKVNTGNQMIDGFLNNITQNQGLNTAIQSGIDFTKNLPKLASNAGSQTHSIIQKVLPSAGLNSTIDKWAQEFKTTPENFFPEARQEQRFYQAMGAPGGEQEIQSKFLDKSFQTAVKGFEGLGQGLLDIMDKVYYAPVAAHEVIFGSGDLLKGLGKLVPQGYEQFGIRSTREEGDKQVADAFGFASFELGNMGINIKDALKGSTQGLKNNIKITDNALTTLGIRGGEIDMSGSNLFNNIRRNVLKAGDSGRTAAVTEAMEWVKQNPITARITAISKKFRINPETVYEGFVQDLSRLALKAPEVPPKTLVQRQMDSVKEFIENPRGYLSSRLKMRSGFINPGKMVGDIGTALRGSGKKPSITDLGVSIPSAPDIFYDTGALTTKILNSLSGRSTVSKKFIEDLTNQSDIKNVEREIIRKLVESEPDTVSVPEFANKVKAELLPLERKNTSFEFEEQDGNFGKIRIYESISLPKEFKGDVFDYYENLYQSPIQTKAGRSHFNLEDNTSYFGHTRVEDMADNFTRRIIEVQSDLYQKDNLEKLAGLTDTEKTKIDLGVATNQERQKLSDFMRLQQYNNPTTHFRLIREELKKAGEDNKKVVLFPTGDTAMKIEGLGEQNIWRVDTSQEVAKPSDLKVGLEIIDPVYEKWVILHVFEDGKFTAVPKSNYIEGVNKYDDAETFDISGKMDTDNPIHKFYEKEIGKYLKNNYAAELFTDNKGVTWWKVDLEQPKVKAIIGKPVFAFKTGGKKKLSPGDITEAAKEKSLLQDIEANNRGAEIDTPPEQVSTRYRDSDIGTESLEESDSLILQDPDTESVLNQRQELDRKIFNATNEDIKATILGRIAGIPGKIQEPMRKILNTLGNALNSQIEKALVSGNSYIRNAANVAHSFAKGIGRTSGLRQQADLLKGGINIAVADANVFQTNLNKAINSDPVAKQKIWSLLDPEAYESMPAERKLFEGKITLEDLSVPEREVYDILKEVSTYMSDVNFLKGRLKEDTYRKNRGQYIARMYDEFELPAEVQEFVTAGVKQDLAMFKQREELTDWKSEHIITDPIYLTAKRWAQTEINNAVQDYLEYIATEKKSMVSDTAKPGFTQISDSKAYGPLKNKFVANQIVEDLKGFFFTNETMQKVYDVFKSIDRNIIIQTQKKMLTVYNPGVQLGNVGSDFVFAFGVGVDPLSFSKSLPEGIKEVVKYGNIYREMLKENMVSTDFTKTDLVNGLKSLENEKGLNSNVIWNHLKSIARLPQEVYGAVDDIAKVSAYIALRKQGFKKPDAMRLVKDGFQNYANVGKIYDFASKTPIVGNRFIKFQADLTRIIKNIAKNRPLHAAGFLLALKTIGDILSSQSGESEAERKVREGRFGFPVIPFFNIPLSFQTPAGELNLARFISPYYVYNNQEGEPDAGEALRRFLPYQLNLEEKTSNPAGIVAVNIAKTVQDPLLSPLIQLAVNSDFRGKPIWDPNETKYQESNMSAEEKNANALMFLFRSYSPQTLKDGIDFMSAVEGKPDYYGREKTQTQAFLRFFGIRQEEFGKEQVASNVQKDLLYTQKGFLTVQDKVKKINQQLESGAIDYDTAQKRLVEPLAELIDLKNQLEELKSLSQQLEMTGADLDPQQQLDFLSDEKAIRKQEIYEKVTGPDGKKILKEYQALKPDERKLYNEYESSLKAQETKKQNKDVLLSNLGTYKELYKLKYNDPEGFKKMYQSLNLEQKKGFKTFSQKFE